MRKMLFLYLLFPLLSKAQRDDYDIAFRKSIPDSLGKPIHLPERYHSDFLYDVIPDLKERTKVLIIGSDSIYHKFFSRYRYTDDSLKKYKKADGDPWRYNWMAKHHVDSLPVIDFSKNELLVYAACAQCLAYCPGGPCHRNSCSFREAWFIREKKQGSKAQPVIRKSLMQYSIDTVPDDSRKWVNLPDISRSDLRKHFEVGQNSSYKYVVGTDSLYYKIFSVYPKDSLPVFDFAKQELVVGISCLQCGSLRGVEKEYGNTYFLNRPMHRNACRYYSFWLVRDKKISGDQAM